MIYENGSSTSNLSGVSTGLAFNGNGDTFATVQSYNGTSKSRTQLAQRFCPPKVDYLKEVTSSIQYHGVFIFSFSVFSIVWYCVINMISNNTIEFKSSTTIFSFVLLLLIFTVVWHVIRFIGNLRNLEAARSQDGAAKENFKNWIESFACLTCGTTFKV